jgi:hypothetical protein
MLILRPRYPSGAFFCKLLQINQLIVSQTDFSRPFWFARFRLDIILIYIII